MVQPDKFWIKDNVDIFDIANSDAISKITWESSLYDNFIQMAEAYFISAHNTLTEIVEAGADNTKSDMWFLAGMYLYRQSIELLCKGLILPYLQNNNEIAATFKQYKHNISEIFAFYILKVGMPPINADEWLWTERYLGNLETVDRESDLFRYPFKDDFLDKYKNRFLDVVDMANGFEQCYSILYKCVDTKHLPLKYQNDIDCSMSTEFLHFSSHGIGNCQLYESPWSDGFYKQIEGYSNVAAFIFNHSDGLNKQSLFFPVAFLSRNAIELALKRLLTVRTEVSVPLHIQISKRNSHRLYKDLWMNIKPIIKHYADASNEDLNQIDIAEAYIKKLEAIDKNGDAFRYPVNYGMQYRFCNQVVDVNNVHSWMQGIFNFLDGCDSMLSAIYDYECEMRSYYY